MPERLHEIIRNKYLATSEERALILGEARKQLKLRKDELLKALSKKVRRIEYHPFLGKYKISIGPGELASFDYQQVRNKLYIYNLTVLNANPEFNSFRKLGIGRLMVTIAISYARHRNLDQVFLNAKPHNYKFYEKLGFVKKNTSFPDTKIETSEFVYYL